jgi:transposase
MERDEEIEQLRAEKIQLQERADLLQEKVSLLQEHANLLQEKVALQAQLLTQQETLQEQVKHLTQHVQELETRLSKDSHNSHLPPSSDRFARQPKSLRKKSNKPSGGQPGHEGHHLMRVQNPDQVVVQTAEICENCLQDLVDQPVDHLIGRQVLDLPAPRLVVTEYQIECKRCPRCQAMTQAPCPEMITAPVQYGSAIQALGVYLSQVQLLPDNRIVDIFTDLLGLPISTGSIHRWIAHCAHHLSPIEEAIKAALQKAKLAHQDETGLYEQGKRLWLHVYATATLTHYGVHAKRGREAMDAIGIAPGFKGISVHDGWESYQGYEYSHALCNVHHLRELTFLEETYQQDWTTQMKALLLQMKRCCDQARASGLLALDATVRQEFITRYEAVIQQGYAANPPDPPPAVPKRGRRKQHPARCLLNRLHGHQEQVLAFLHHLFVPFDNSQAERDLRMVKVQQKVSGCFRSPSGTRFFCRIRGYISTMRKQGHALLPLLEGSLTGYPVLPQF